jgi:glycosyltransferase involved in cell wall biosynthesis
MREDQEVGLTNGCLPMAAFEHLEPTAIGVLDLERSIVPRSPDGRAWSSSQRDGLVLVRLHADPLAVLHIDHGLAGLSKEVLAEEVWRQAAGKICRHIERFECASVPNAAGELIASVQSHAQGCHGCRPAKPALSVAVIVATVGREAQLERCLRSLLAQRASDFELIVVDNRPATGRALRTVSALAAEDPRVRYLAERQAGSSIARNRGVRETNAELVAFTDDDVIVDSSWLEWLLAPFTDAEVMATCGMVLPLELETEAQKHFELHGGFSKGIERRSYDLLSGRDAGLPLYPFLGDAFGSGNSMAFRRAEFVAFRGFDPALGGGSPAPSGEDLYAFTTAILRGGRLVYEPRAVCWHEHRKDAEALHRQIFDYGVGFSAIMTKALLSGDPRFFQAIARSLPVMLRRLRRGDGSTAGGTAKGLAFSRELARTQYAGMLRGPLRYAQGVARTRSLGLER